VILLTPKQQSLRFNQDAAEIITEREHGPVELHDLLRVLAWRYGWETLVEAAEEGMQIEERNQL
jgi:hypothetical protein